MLAYRLAGLFGVALGLFGPGQAAANQRSVEIPPELTSLATSGHVEGGSSIVYLLTAQEGQRLIVSFAATSPEACFSVSAPGSEEELFEGESGVNSADIVLPASGQYSIHVYLMEAAALRGDGVDYRLGLRLSR